MTIYEIKVRVKTELKPQFIIEYVVHNIPNVEDWEFLEMKKVE